MTAWLTLEQALTAPAYGSRPCAQACPRRGQSSSAPAFDLKRIPYALVDARDADRSLTALQTLTGQGSLPVLFWNNERPRSGWLDHSLLAERIAPRAPLLPMPPLDRSKVIGLIAELCSESGFGWHRRVIMIDRLLTEPGFR